MLCVSGSLERSRKLSGQEGWLIAQWPEQAGSGLRLFRPDVVAGEADMLPAERGDMPDQLGRHRPAAMSERIERRLQIARVPQDDGSDQQVQPRCPIGLVLERAVAQLAQAVEEYRASKRIACFSLVQPGVGAPAQLAAAEPVEHEKASLDAPDLAQRHRQPVLPRVGGQAPQHARRRGMTGADGDGEPQRLVPVCTHVVAVHRAADQACQKIRHGLAAEGVESAILEVAQSWGEAEAEHREQPEDLVGGAARVRVVLGDAQPRAMLEQPVQHMRRLGRGRCDDFGVEGAELVGDVGVERDAGLVAVSGVDVAQRLAPAARPEELPIRAGGAAIAPSPGERQRTMRLDQPREGQGVAFLAHVPVVRPGELAQAGTPAGLRHPGQAQVDAVGQHRGEQRRPVVGGPATALVGEALRESGPAIYLQQHVGDLGPRHQVVGVLRKPPRLGWLLGLQRGDPQAALVERGVG